MMRDSRKRPADDLISALISAKDKDMVGRHGARAAAAAAGGRHLVSSLNLNVTYGLFRGAGTL
jgi:hypothetical protein